ncbi:hypothetical protein [Pantoea phage Nafs113]|nr:hypothetical protein [Pantoea phage Nafs113]
MLSFIPEEMPDTRSMTFEVDIERSGMTNALKAIKEKEEELIRKALHIFTGTDDETAWAGRIELIIDGVNNEQRYMCGDRPVLILKPLVITERGHGMSGRPVIDMAIPYAAFTFAGDRVQL